jgi:hypothetical protein
MIGKIATVVLCLAYSGALFGTGGLAAAEGNRANRLAQTGGGPSPAGLRPPESAGPLPQEKTRTAPAKEPTPAAPLKSEPVKPFEPTEKVKADQALEFPADI